MYERKCPTCNKNITYKTKHSKQKADKKRSECSTCCRAGSNNPMYGKTIDEVWNEKYGEQEAKNKRLKVNKKAKENYHCTDAMRENARTKSLGSNNPMYGKSVLDIWIKKYGIDEANKRWKDVQNKKSIKNKGILNPMYGKPSPIGSGNGWSGWYNGFYFRSLLELSYLVYLVENKISFRSAETKEFRIKYIDTFKNSERTYCPDIYLIESQELIEIKPKKLLSTQNNIDKHKIAKEIYGNKFKIMTEEQIIKLTNQKIKELHDTKEIKFLNRYEQKFQEKYK